MHGWDGEFDIKCETEFRAQGKRLGKHLFDMFPSAFDNQKGFISAKSEILEISNTCIWSYLPVQYLWLFAKYKDVGCEGHAIMPLKGNQDILWKMEEIANGEQATVFLEFCFRSLRTLALSVCVCQVCWKWQHASTAQCMSMFAQASAQV